MAAAFTNDQLVACARREVAMRKRAYPRFDKKEHISECSQTKQDEHAMMQLIADQLEALPELLRRQQALRDELALAYKGADEFSRQLQKYIDTYGPLN